MAHVYFDLATVVTEAQSDSTPARLGSPALDDGPHVSYAIQWFAFAIISIVGLVIFLRRT